MWFGGKSSFPMTLESLNKLELRALNLPCSELDLSGHWKAVTDCGIAASVTFVQHGVTIFGNLQGKFATGPITIQGSIIESRLTAICWRAEKQSPGSGWFDLAYDASNSTLTGVGTWFGPNEHKEVYRYTLSKSPKLAN